MINQELLSSLEYIEKEKGVEKSVLLEALRQALLSACKKTYPDREGIEIDINPDTCRIRLLCNGAELKDPHFGRIAAQTAKQVIIQKIREAERESIYDVFVKKEGDIVTGSVHRLESKAIIVDLGKAEGILPAREQSPQEEYRQGDIIRVYLLEVKKTPRGPEIILSRSHAGLVKRLFEQEVPEIHDGIVQVKGIVREAGSRTKIAVSSSDSNIDCVGSCVGVRGQRVKNIVRELNGEKIDIIRYSEETEAYIRNGMSPAVLAEIHLNRKDKTAEILVEDDQLSLAIGKKGQNVRLASKLVGWSLDVRSLSQRIPISSLEGVGKKTGTLLKEAGIQSLKDILKSTAEDLMKIPGIGPKTAEKIIASAHRAILEKGDKKKEEKIEKPAEPEAPPPAAEEAGEAMQPEQKTEEAPEEKSNQEESKEGSEENNAGS